jgi:hypothetical protein
MNRLPTNLVPDLREPRLPKWAQDALANMRRRVKEAEDAARAARLGTIPSESDMVLDRHSEVPIGLGRNPTVRVVLSRDRSHEVEDYLDVRLNHDRSAVEIMGSSTLRIRPQVTNVISVGVAPLGEE